MEKLPPLWAHQSEGVKRALKLPGFGFFFEMGCGKSRTLIETLRARFNGAKRILRTLVLCPPIVVPNWRDEFMKYSKIREQDVVLLQGHRDRRTGLLLENGYKDGLKKGCILVTNYEALLMPPLFDALMEWQPEVLVLDESHKCKDAKSQRTKKCIELAKGADYRYLLSGSPVLNSPMDIYSQFLILDKGKTFGKNFFAFRATYFIDKNAGMPKQRYFPDWQIRAGALEVMNKKIALSALRVEKKDCLDLPPLVRQTIKVGMTPEQARMYQEMKNEFITFMGDEAVSATLAITKALRLMQISSGYVKTVEGKEISLDDTPKMEALRELLAELTPNHKVLVWAVWKENYAQIKKVCEDLSVGYVEIHGDVPSKRKFENVAAFQNDPSVRVLIGHPGSGGIGINLIAATYSIFYSRTFSLEHSLQAEARNHRGGSEIHEKITRIDLVCEGTVDEAVAESLSEKIDISDKMLLKMVLDENKDLRAGE